MENSNNGPGKKPATNDENASETGLNETKEEENSTDESEDKSQNYMNGEDDVNGPDFDKKSKSGEGDSGQNAGVFK